MAYPNTPASPGTGTPSEDSQSVVGTGELLFGSDTDPSEASENETRPGSAMAKIPGVHVGGGITGTLHAMATGCLDLPGVSLNLLDPVIPTVPSPHTTAP